MKAEAYNAFFPKAISAIINEKGLKQCAVAERAGIKQKAFSDMLNGRRIIKVVDIINISRALGIEPGDIFHTVNERNSA